VCTPRAGQMRKQARLCYNLQGRTTKQVPNTDASSLQQNHAHVRQTKDGVKEENEKWIQAAVTRTMGRSVPAAVAEHTKEQGGYKIDQSAARARIDHLPCFAHFLRKTLVQRSRRTRTPSPTTMCRSEVDFRFPAHEELPHTRSGDGNMNGDGGGCG